MQLEDFKALQAELEQIERKEIPLHELYEDQASDSSEDDRPRVNTIGDVPLEWYEHEKHIGYDVEGKKLGKKQGMDKLEWLIKRNDDPNALRTIRDDLNGEEITLSKQELKMLMRLRVGKYPHVEVNPYEPYVDWFSGKVRRMPVADTPVRKSAFAPPKWEEKQIVKIIRAMRRGWIKPRKDQEQEEEKFYLMWGDDNLATGSDKTASGLTYIPAPKPKLPGNEESYNPPKEFLPTEEEKTRWEMEDGAEEKPDFISQAFPCLRLVPAYSDFIKERFERCLDLYLCPRVQRKRPLQDPESLVPKLPKAEDLRPFPTTIYLKYEGHQGLVKSVAIDPQGEWLLSGGKDGTLRVWEVTTGRCMQTWQFDKPVLHVEWNIINTVYLACACYEDKVVILQWGVHDPDDDDNIKTLMNIQSAVQLPDATWRSIQGGIEIKHNFDVSHFSWHYKGDYFAVVCPTGNTKSVVVHQLSKRTSQCPFRKNKGRVRRVLFHPLKPLLFVATNQSIRIYDLVKQALWKKLIASSAMIMDMSIHPSGDHVLVGTSDPRVAWFDLDFKNTPFKVMRHHKGVVQGVAFHQTYPLFASCSDDGRALVFHGMVYKDLATDPLLVPLKILRGHQRQKSLGVTACLFHPNQPWLFTCGSDGQILLHCH
eukprot:TRINITY_DN4507_c0_g1_i8.p1 TRINITY_DN4507_c0_g1~~TRINITY_DN4507_c0_g1_i8.p1  ORF type:complete len:725 (-),score=120.31 TRINITY_DN4507_c0_g1_i8:319-2268(-)